MTEPGDVPGLAEVLKFRPRWWADPVPDWLFQDLDARTRREIAVVQLEAVRVSLQAQIDALGKSIEIISRQG